jgi:hypothetical protein
MRFSVAAPGTLPPSSPRPPRPPAPAALGRFRKERTEAGLYEIVRAVTADGQWLFERLGPGDWAAGCLPTETETRRGFRSLAACRAYVADGQAQADLERIQAQDGNEGVTV